MDGIVWELEEGGVFSKSNWNKSFAVMSNIGFLRFNEKDVLEPPDLYGIKTLKVETMRGQKRNGRDNLFELKVTNPEGKVQSRVFSVDDPQTYTRWEKKIKEILDLRKKDGKFLIKPRDESETVDKFAGEEKKTKPITPKGGAKKILRESNN